MCVNDCDLETDGCLDSVEDASILLLRSETTISADETNNTGYEIESGFQVTHKPISCHVNKGHQHNEILCDNQEQELSDSVQYDNAPQSFLRNSAILLKWRHNDDKDKQYTLTKDAHRELRRPYCKRDSKRQSVKTSAQLYFTEQNAQFDPLQVQNCDVKSTDTSYVFANDCSNNNATKHSHKGQTQGTSSTDSLQLLRALQYLQLDSIKLNTVKQPLNTYKKLKKASTKHATFPSIRSGFGVVHNFQEARNELVESSQTISNLDDLHIPVWHHILKPDEDSDNLLFSAIICERSDLAVSMIDLLPDYETLSATNKMFQTALHLAALTNNSLVSRRLVVAGAKVHLRDIEGNTPLHIACKYGNNGVVKTLLNHVRYVETKQNTYHIPYQPLPQDLEIRNYDGLSCLHLATIFKHKETMDTLLDIDADVNAEDVKSGRTCLHIAAEMGDLELVNYLCLRHNIDINAKTYAGYTPTETAFYRSHYEIVHRLEQLGAEIPRSKSDLDLSDLDDMDSDEE